MSLRQEDIDQINNFMNNPDNIKKLAPIEAACVNLYYLEFQEKIAPIIMNAIARDEGKSKFFFRL